MMKTGTIFGLIALLFGIAGIVGALCGSIFTAGAFASAAGITGPPD